MLNFGIISTYVKNFTFAYVKSKLPFGDQSINLGRFEISHCRDQCGSHNILSYLCTMCLVLHLVSHLNKLRTAWGLVRCLEVFTCDCSHF